MNPEEQKAWQEVARLHSIIDLIEEALMVRGPDMRDRLAKLIRESRVTKYKLVFDEVFGGNTETDAYARMARTGTWDGDWWEPNPSQLAEKRIEREGYIIMGHETSP